MSTQISKHYKNVSRSGYSAEELGNTEIARLQMIADLIPDTVHTILDAGCGEGIITNPLYESGKEIIGTDISFDSLKFLNSERLQSSTEQMPFGDETFDLVLSSSVLEHLPEELLSPVANEMIRISRKYILVSTPYKEILWKTLTKCPRCGSIYHANLHLHSFDENRLIELFKNCSVMRMEFGAPGNWKSEPLVWIAQHLFNHYAYSASAIQCPVCGLVFSKKKEPNTVVSHTPTRKEAIGKSINTVLNRVTRFSIQHPSHVAILFSK